MKVKQIYLSVLDFLARPCLEDSFAFLLLEPVPAKVRLAGDLLMFGNKLTTISLILALETYFAMSSKKEAKKLIISSIIYLQ